MPQMSCRVCGAQTEEGMKFCSVCGAAAPQPTYVSAKPCTACGAKIEEGMRFCMVCGNPVHISGPTADIGQVPNGSAELETETVEETESEPEAVSEPEKTVEPIQVTEGESIKEAELKAEPIAAPKSAPPYAPGMKSPEENRATTSNPVPPFVPVPPPQQNYQQQYQQNQKYRQPPYWQGQPQPGMSSAPASVDKPDMISVGGWIGIFFLMLIPIVNLILLIIWACGGCRKTAKTKYARAVLIMAVIMIILSIVMFILFKEVFLPRWIDSWQTQFGRNLISDITDFLNDIPSLYGSLGIIGS